MNFYKVANKKEISLADRFSNSILEYLQGITEKKELKKQKIIVKNTEKKE